MTEMVTKERSSIQKYARLGGLLYLIIIVLGISSEFLFRGKLIVNGNAAATAQNIQGSPLLWRLGIVSEYLAISFTIILAMIYFFLLQPVDRKLNLLATLFRLVSIIVQVVVVLNLLNTLFFLDQSELLASFSIQQRYALADISIKSHTYGYGISLLFSWMLFPCTW